MKRLIIIVLLGFFIAEVSAQTPLSERRKRSDDSYTGLAGWLVTPLSGNISETGRIHNDQVEVAPGVHRWLQVDIITKNGILKSMLIRPTELPRVQKQMEQTLPPGSYAVKVRNPSINIIDRL